MTTLATQSYATVTRVMQLGQGPRILKQLADAGIAASKVTKNQRTNAITITFNAPNMSNFHARGTDPARVWAQRIEDCFTDVEIIDTYDSVYEWRPQQPIGVATVFLRVVANEKTA